MWQCQRGKQFFLEPVTNPVMFISIVGDDRVLGVSATNTECVLLGPVNVTLMEIGSLQR